MVLKSIWSKTEKLAKNLLSYSSPEERLTVRAAKITSLLEDGRSDVERVLNKYWPSSGSERGILVRAVAENLSAESRFFLTRWLKKIGYIEELMEGLFDSDRDTCLDAVNTLAALRYRPAGVLLVDVLSTRDEEVQWTVVKALIKLKDPATLGPLVAALEQPQRWVPARVADVIIEFGEAAVSPLIKLGFKTGDEGTRVSCIDLFGEIGREEAVPFLKAMLEDEVLAVRGRAASALARIGGHAARPVLEKILQDETWQVAATAKKVLEYT